jgi:hypothetical protein
MAKGDVKVDGESISCPLPSDATLASAFVYLRDHILRDGKIVTDVRIDDDPVTWEDGSPGWSELLSSDHELSIASDYPIRITSPLLARLVETLPTVAAKHREFAGKLRAQDPTASEGMAELLGVWQDLQQALDQVCQLHGLELEVAPWSEVAGVFRGRFDRLSQMLRELKESLELRDMVLSADLLDFEFAPLAEDFIEPCDQFRVTLETHQPARSRS